MGPQSQREYAIVEQDSVGECITISYASLTDCHDEDVSHETLLAVIADLGAKGWELVAATDAFPRPNAAFAAMPPNDGMTGRGASSSDSLFASHMALDLARCRERVVQKSDTKVQHPSCFRRRGRVPMPATTVDRTPVTMKNGGDIWHPVVDSSQLTS